MSWGHDFDADLVAAGLVAELDSGFGDAVGVGQHDRAVDGGGGSVPSAVERSWNRPEYRGRFPVRSDQFHADRFGTDAGGFVLASLAFQFHAGDETQPDRLLFKTSGDDVEILVAGLFAGGDFYRDGAARVTDRRGRGHGQVGTVHRHEMNRHVRDRGAAALSAEQAGNFGAEEFDLEFLFEIVSGQGALFIPGDDFDPVDGTALFVGTARRETAR